MKPAKLIGLLLVAVFAVSAVAASSASALEWLLNGKPITKAVSVNSKSIGKLVLEDLAATGGATAIECEGTDSGTVGPGDKDEIKTVKATACNFVSGKNGSCTSGDAVTAKAVGLPWPTLLLTVSGLEVDDVTSSGSAGVGWDVECTVAGIIKVQDTCTTKETKTMMSNTTKGVAAEFIKTEKAGCSLGNSTSGMVEGVDLNESPEKETLSIT